MPNNLQHFTKNLASFISFLAAGFAFLLVAPVPCSAADMIHGIDVTMEMAKSIGGP
jgi:hypothetical protein